MDQHVQEQLDEMRKTDPQVDTMVREHRELDAKVSHLAEKSHLTPEEDVELHRLKKEKLLLKDKLEALIHQQKSA